MSETVPVEAIDNIVLISVDSFRLDRVHAERNDTPLTPHLDELASRSLEFAEGISPGPATADSVPAMLTGGYPSQFSGFSLPSAGTTPLTLAEHLQDAGFSCAGFNQNNLIARRYNFDRGFDYYYDISEETRQESGRGIWRLRARKLLEDTPFIRLARWAQTTLMERFGKSLYVLDEPGDSLTDRALDWLDATDDRRFLWLHYMDTHHPYISDATVHDELGVDIPRQEMLQLSRKARSDAERLTDTEVERLKLHYDCSVRFVDKQIGRLVTHLVDENAFDNTLFIVTADHGEEFLDHGAFGHRDALWDELIRVPLIVWYPPIGDVTVDGQAPVQSLVETVINGNGWFDMLDGGADYIISETKQGLDGIRSCRGREYKLIRDGEDEFITHHGDATETIVEEDALTPEIVENLRERLHRSYQQFGTDTPAVDEETLRDDLAALGYLAEDDE